MDTGTVYEYWRSAEARAEENDPRTQYIRRQEEEERNPDPCRYHDIDCLCADCQWEVEQGPYQESEWDRQRKAELAEFDRQQALAADLVQREAREEEFDRDSECMEASWNREGRCHTRMQS